MDNKPTACIHARGAAELHLTLAALINHFNAGEYHYAVNTLATLVASVLCHLPDKAFTDALAEIPSSATHVNQKAGFERVVRALHALQRESQALYAEHVTTEGEPHAN